jgi:hypothetical protein
MNRVSIVAAMILAWICSFEVCANARDICLAVSADGTKDAASFRKLVNTELGRHPKFRIVEKSCDGTLAIDLLVVEKRQYLTVRMDNDIPYRYPLNLDDNLADKLNEGISTVLSNDPEVLLQNIDSYSKGQRMLRPLVSSAENIWAFELYESLVRTGKSESDLVPGFAFFAGRNAGHWTAFLRLHLSGFPKEPASKKAALQVDAGFSLGVNYEFLERRNTSPYIGFGLQLKYFRMAAMTADKGADNLDEVMPIIFGRIGVRFFRIYAMHCDIFLSGELPILPTGSEETYMFTKKRYTPFAHLGMAVGF